VTLLDTTRRKSWNWYGYPTDFTVVQLAEHTVGWLLAGLVLASIVRPSTKSSPVA
jgi:hypothetical protein